MKKIILLLISVLIIWGCQKTTTNKNLNNSDSTFNRNDSLDILYFKLSNKKYDTLIRAQLSLLAEKYRTNSTPEKYFKISKKIVKHCFFNVIA